MSDAYLYLGEIRVDGDTQARVAMDTEEIDYFAGIMKAHGEQQCPFPAIKVIYDGQNRWLYDGFHRYEAAIKASYNKLRAVVELGTLEDAKWKCLGVNVKRAIPRTNADKRNAVLRALAHPNGQGVSEGVIAQHCGVSQKLVNTIKQELAEIALKAAKVNTPQETDVHVDTLITTKETPPCPDDKLNKKIVRTRNGKTMVVDNIGKRTIEQIGSPIVTSAATPVELPPGPVANPTAPIDYPIPDGMMLVPISGGCYHAPDCDCHKNCISSAEQPVEDVAAALAAF